MGAARAPTLGRREFVAGMTVVGAGALVTGCGLFDDGPERISYGDEPSQFGELYEPNAPEPWPVVVSIHGGSWQDDQDLSIMRGACDDLRRRGFAVWNTEYRRVGEEGGGFPGTFDDIAASIDHLRVIAANHAISTDRVVLLGHSAGGTLALWAAGRSSLPTGAPGAEPRLAPMATVSLAGVTDLGSCANQNLIEGACARFLGGLPTERPDRYALVSPIERLPISLTQVVMHGGDDRIVPVDQATSYASAAQATGDPAAVHVIDGANHFSLIEPDQPAWSAVVDQVEGLQR